MKRSLLLLVFFLPLFSFSQLEFEKVIEIDSTSKEILFNRAKYWVATNFEAPDKVIKLEDIESGTLVLHINYKYNCTLKTGSSRHTAYIPYVLEVFLKDDRYKYRFSDFVHPTQGLLYDRDTNPTEYKYKSEQKYYNKLWVDIILQTKLEIAKTAASFNLTLENPLESEKDW